MFLRRVQPPLEDERSEPPGEHPLSRTLCLELRSLWRAGQDQERAVAAQVKVSQQKNLKPGEYPLSRTLCMELRCLWGAGQD